MKTTYEIRYLSTATYEKTLTVAADSEEEACEIAESMVEDGKGEWIEVDRDDRNDSPEFFDIEEIACDGYNSSTTEENKMDTKDEYPGSSQASRSVGIRAPSITG